MSKKNEELQNNITLQNLVSEATTREATPQAEEVKTEPKKTIRAAFTREEAQKAKALLQTRGKKGCELPRLNVGFTDENVEYIKTMSSVSGITITEFLNYLVNRSYEENKELFQVAKEIRSQFQPTDGDKEGGN